MGQYIWFRPTLTLRGVTLATEGRPNSRPRKPAWASLRRTIHVLFRKHPVHRHPPSGAGGKNSGWERLATVLKMPEFIKSPSGKVTCGPGVKHQVDGSPCPGPEPRGSGGCPDGGLTRDRKNRLHPCLSPSKEMKIERAVITSQGDKLQVLDRFGPSLPEAEPEEAGCQTLGELERAHMRKLGLQPFEWAAG